MLMNKIKSGELPGKQVDWGAWAANVTKQQILDFVDAVYEPHPGSMVSAGLEPALDELRDFTRTLPDRRYALVASEL